MTGSDPSVPDASVAAAAVELGFVSADELDAMLRRRPVHATPPASLADLLEEALSLTPADRLRLDARARDLAGRPEPSRARADAAAAGVQSPTPTPSLRDRPRDPESLRPMPAGRYRDFAPVGEGGMGVVYRALDTELDREVAVKLVRPRGGGDGLTSEGTADGRGPSSGADDRDAAARFLREAWITGRLEHPGIVPVHEIGRAPSGLPYYTMRLVGGGRTLRQALDERRGAAFEARLELIEAWLKACDAVGFAHARGVLHRDLKPENVVLGEHGEAYVLDWGLARGEDDRAAAPRSGAEPDPAATPHDGTSDASSRMGTAGYVAPEALSATPSAPAPTLDVYGLGVMLFEVLTGRRPFTFRTASEYAATVSSEDPPAAAAVAPSVPLGLSATCTRALSRDPRARPSDAAMLATDVRRALAEDQVERQVAVWLQAAREAVEAATRDGTDAAADRAAAASVRVLEARPGNVEARRLLDEAHALRTAAEQLRARRRTRQVLVRVGVGLVAVAGAAALLVARALDDERRAAVAARDVADAERTRADRERDGAESLADFMIMDLSRRLVGIGRQNELEAVVQKAAAHYESLPYEEREVARNRKRALALAEVGWVLLLQGKAEAALGRLEAAWSLNRRMLVAHPARRDIRSDAAVFAIRMTTALRRLGRSAEAVPLLEEAERAVLAGGEAVLAEPDARFLLAAARGERAGELLGIGRRDEAVAVLEASVADLAAIDATKTRNDVSTVASHQCATLATQLLVAGRHDAARERLREAIRHAEDARRRRSDAVDPVKALGKAHRLLAMVEDSAGRADAAAKEASEAVALLEPLLSRLGRDVEFRVELASTRMQRGEVLLRSGARDEARRELTQARSALLDVGGTTPNATVTSQLAMVELHLARLEQASGDAVRARELVDSSLARLEPLVAAARPEWGHARVAAQAYGTRAHVLASLEDAAGALAARRAAVAAYEKAHRIQPGGVLREEIGKANLALGIALAGAGDADAALAAWAESRRSLEAARDEGLLPPKWRGALAEAWARTGELEATRGRTAAALVAFQAAIRVLEPESEGAAPAPDDVEAARSRLRELVGRTPASERFSDGSGR